MMKDEASPRATSLSKIKSGVEHKPPRIFLYGTHGIGKTTFAAKTPSPILICTEEGAEEIDVPKFPRAESSDDVLLYLRDLYREPHSYQTVCIDSADWLEDMVQREVARTHTATELGYGRDSQMVAARIGEILTALNFLREKQKMAAVVIAHSEIKRFDSPMTEPYDRYQPKLQRAVSALLQEWADVVLFATYDVAVATEDVGFNKKVRRGVSDGERIIYTSEQAAFYAKNRYGMPPSLAMPPSAPFKEVAAAIPYYKAAGKVESASPAVATEGA